MSEVTVFIRFRIALARQPDMLRDLGATAERTRQEPACRAFDFFLTDGDPGAIVVLQDWDTLAAYQHHQKASALRRLSDRYAADLVGPPTRMVLTGETEQVGL